MRLISANIFILVFVLSGFITNANATVENPLGSPGQKLNYTNISNDLPESVVSEFELVLGESVLISDTWYQWLLLNAEKSNHQKYSVQILCSEYPLATWKDAEKVIARYILDTGSQSIEFINSKDKSAILPNTGAWQHLLPRNINGENPFSNSEKRIMLLGQEYKLQNSLLSDISKATLTVHRIELTPDLKIGAPHNKKVKNETRRYDESDYEYIEFTKENYFEMIANGMNVFNVNSKQVKWIQNENIYYWGIGGADISYPEDLYRSNYLGPAIFFDEPMVHTRDQALKPKFKKDPSLRKTITPKIYFDEFKNEYHKAKYERSPTLLLKGLKKRKDVDIGNMDFLQQNVYSWETMVSSAIYQLSEGGDATPSAIVFEPPGRFGANRVLPELNMCFDCQIPADDPKNIIGIIKGFIRGAARVTGKDWGISIYGQVDRSEAYWYMTHAYDQGATQFYYWDSYQLAAVPYNEYLALSKNLREYSKLNPYRNLEKLKLAAEVAILLPVGYNLGHVKMGIGNIGGLPELNRERLNSSGVKYRDVLNNFYIEIERCIRLGIDYDLFWNLDELKLRGYRELITIREDGKVEVKRGNKKELLESARTPARPEGIAPNLSVNIEITDVGTSPSVKATAIVKEESAPIYYTMGADKNGIYNNQYVLWELFGPEEEDYTDFWNDRWNAQITEGIDSASAEIKFRIETPGNYRLRVSTSDLAGRSTVIWKEISISK